MTTIIDYDAGNIKSVEKALHFLGEETVISRDPEVLLQAERVILPGVGAFGDAMTKIHDYKLEETIYQIIEKGIPFLGICLGLQLLFEESEECEGVRGLGLLKGKIVKIQAKDGIKIPHIGWNSLHFPKESRLFAGIEEDSYVYFVHSYYAQAKDRDIVAATTEYGAVMDVGIETGNLYACQFHPEKSSDNGMQILKNFISICKEEA